MRLIISAPLTTLSASQNFVPSNGMYSMNLTVTSLSWASFAKSTTSSSLQPLVTTQLIFTCSNPTRLASSTPSITPASHSAHSAFSHGLRARSPARKVIPCPPFTTCAERRETPKAKEFFLITGSFEQPLFNAAIPATYRKGRIAVALAQQELNRALLSEVFGLRTDGRVESILMSLPPEVRWEYGQAPAAASPEAESLAAICARRDWAGLGV